MPLGTIATVAAPPLCVSGAADARNLCAQFGATRRARALTCADIINTLLETPMAVALMLALLLDNTLPGTWEERGLNHWNLLGSHRDMSAKAKLAYDLPFGLSEKVRV